MLLFSHLLLQSHLSPTTIRLLRHRHLPRLQRQLYHDALHRHPRFEQYQASQSKPAVIKSICSASAIASFVAAPTGETVFVGMWRVVGPRPEPTPDPYLDASAPPSDSCVTIVLERMTELAEYSGRLVIDWGSGERAWVQYADRREKEIAEIRRTVEDPPFPGFAQFIWQLHEVDSLPTAWLEALRSSKGVYLLVDRETGAQYVGSATGADGFIGRWRSYANGHGGNVALRELAHPADRYQVCVLETAGSAATIDEVCALESRWKNKLGSRVTGLNRN